MYTLRNFVLAVAAVTSVLISAAERPKTSDLLAVSGSRAVRRWKSAERQWIQGNAVYTSWDSITLLPRKIPFPKTEVKIWMRGIPESNLFLLDRTAPSAASACVASDRHSWLSFEMSSAVEVGYAVCFPADQFDKAQGEIVVAVNDAEPDRVNISFEHDEGFFESRLANALLSPVLTATGGLVGGALIGYLGFRAQQRYLRRSEEMKGFRDRKLQAIRQLITFFRDTYPIYRNSEEPNEAVKVKDLREVLISSDVYAIMAPDDIRELNQICDSEFTISRLADFDRLIARNFGEFVPSGKELLK